MSNRNPRENQQQDNGADGVMNIGRGTAAKHLEADKQDNNGWSKPPPMREDVSKLRNDGSVCTHKGRGMPPERDADGEAGTLLHIVSDRQSECRASDRHLMK